MTNEELDALVKRLREGKYSYCPGDPARAADAIRALRSELVDAKHHAQARLVALRETETELQCAESEKDALRRELASRDALISDHLRQIMHLENRVEEEATRAEKAELANSEQARLVQETINRADAALRRELADAKDECEGVASEAAKMLTEYLETRDAAQAEARELREALQELLEDHEYLFEKENLARMKARAALTRIDAALAGKGEG